MRPKDSPDFFTQAWRAALSPTSTDVPTARALCADENVANSSPVTLRAQYETFAPSDKNASTILLPIPRLPPENELDTSLQAGLSGGISTYL